MAPKRSDSSQPRESLGPGDDPTRAVDRLYREGRTFPQGKPPINPQPRAGGKLPPLDSDDRLANRKLDDRTNPQKPQSDQDQHATNYDNDVSRRSWLRGGGEDATRRPFFDKGNAWRGQKKLRED